MLTKKVKRRIVYLLLFIFILSIFIFLTLRTLNDNILYFLTPTEINEKENLKKDNLIRIGGMVKKNSIQTNSKEIQFIITDEKNEIIVSYSGTVPNLFSEGKGVIAEGKLKDKKFFIADRILAKHDENYMPPKVKKSKGYDAK
tara:strand:- start:67 stop:495 length:429 start_codon:yes stop_codon:yes gene_type:complete